MWQSTAIRIAEHTCLRIADSHSDPASSRCPVSSFLSCTDADRCIRCVTVPVSAAPNRRHLDPNRRSGAITTARRV
jgi:hypothetical protein